MGSTMIRCCILLVSLWLQSISGFQGVVQSLQTSLRRRNPLSQLESQKSDLQDQREELEKTLQRIDELKSDLKRADSETSLSKSRNEINLLADELATTLAAFVPPIGLSSEKYTDAMRLFLQLPPSVRYTLVESLSMEGKMAGDYQSIPEIVAMLYEKQTNPSATFPTALSVQKIETLADIEELIQSNNPSLLLEKNETAEIESTFRAFFGYLSRHTESSPTSEDVATITRILKDAKFLSNNEKPIRVGGACIIPGIERTVDAGKLLSCIDANVTEDWECSVSLIYNIFEEEKLEPFEQPGYALLVFKRDFSKANSWLYYLCTLSALATSLQFSFNIYGKNQVLDVASIDSIIGSIAGVSQFLIPFFSILLVSELGQFYMAQKDNIKTRFPLPVLLPFPEGIPLYGTLTRISSPPSNLTSLFDFAVVGPLIGFISSLGFMAAGTVMPSLSDNQAFSTGASTSLSVGILKLSTFGASLVDYIDGGSGFLTGQANDATVSLNPLFIAGYCGMILSAASLIPIGATNGGRLSLSIFGRRGHSVISGATWIALLAATFTLDDEQGRLLTTAWMFSSLAQNDMEIPCKNETDEVDAKRLALGFSLWFLAVLILVPM